MKPKQLMEHALWIHLLGLCLESGLDLHQAITVLYQQISTESPVKRFMKSLYRHQPTPEEQHRLLAHVGQMISFGIRNGTPLGPILKETAERLTQEALFSTEKGLYIKQLAILLPLFLCILPAVFIVILTPLLIHLFLTPF